MTAKTVTPEADDAAPSEKKVNEAIEKGQQALKDALAQAETRIREASKSADKVLRERVETLRAHAKPYADNAGQHVSEAQRYVLDQVKERPVTAALAGLGVGLLLGVIIGRKK